MIPPLSREHLRRAGRILLVTAVYVLAGKSGLALASIHPSATVVWAPTGIALASFLLLGGEVWIGVFLGAFIVNATTAGSVFTTLAIACGNTLEGYVGALLVRRYAGWPETFESTRQFFAFIIAGAFVATALSATIGVTALSIAGFADWERYTDIWLTWWVGDAVGAIVVAPLIILWFRRPSERPQPSVNMAEASVFACIAALSAFIAFGQIFLERQRNLPIAYLCIPSVIWAAVRFGSRAAVTLVGAISVLAIAVTLRGIGPFGAMESGEALVLLQVFIAIIAITGLMLSAAIAEHARSEEAYRQSQERFRGIFNASKDGIVFKSLQGEIIDINEAFALMSGYPRQELHRDMTYQDLTPMEYHAMEEAKTQELLRTGIPAEFEKEYVRKDGTRFFALVTAFLVRGGRGKIGIATIVKDITRRKREEMAKTQFMAIASHQLRTPLSAMRWALNSLRVGIGQSMNASDSEILGGAEKSAKTMAKTIETLLLLSEIEAGRVRLHPSRVRLDELFSDIAGAFQQELSEKNQSLIVECPPRLQLETDRNILRHILSNLVSNACKYSPARGIIRMRAEQQQHAIHISVADGGLGIPVLEQPKIFSLFFRGKNAMDQKIEGMGLGLYLVRSLTLLLGGTISFQADEEKDTTFSLSLPVIANGS